MSDVGSNHGADGKLMGDVEFASAVQRAAAITPEPGGVGRMTIACPLASTLESVKGRVNGWRLLHCLLHLRDSFL